MNKTIIALSILFVLIIGGLVYSYTGSNLLESSPTSSNTESSSTPKTSNFSNSFSYSASSSMDGTYYNPTYGLRLKIPPSWAGYAVQTTNSAFGGLPSSNSIHFYVFGRESFVINVFTKEEWNNLRITETNNNVNSYGEGEYLGENGTFIFSSQVFLNQTDVESILYTAGFY